MEGVGSLIFIGAKYKISDCIHAIILIIYFLWQNSLKYDSKICFV